MLEGKLLEVVVVCIGGGSNVMGMFYLFVYDEEVVFYGVEVVGKGVYIEKYVVILMKGSVGVFYGLMMYFL